MPAFQKKNNNTNSPKVVRPFCKVCHDAGKVESEYTSHFVRSEPGPNGVVVCPTLLSQLCTYCGCAGHTVSYCVALKKRSNNDARSFEKEKEKARIQHAEENTRNKVANPSKKFASNAFNMLSEDNDENDCKKKVVNKEVVNKVVDEFPALCASKKPEVVARATFSYASMAAKQPMFNEEQASAFMGVPIKQQQSKQKQINVKARQVVKSWADWTDSDEDENDDDDYYTSLPSSNY